MPEHYDLGILLVHGIGSQKRGDTLLHFGEPMADSLGEWLDKDAVDLRRTELVQPGAGAPAHSHVIVTHKGETKSVLVAESWWADSFGPPPWWPFAKWLLWSAPFVILRATDHRVSLIATHNNLDGVRLPAPPGGLRKWSLEGVRVVKNALSVLIALVATIGILLLGIVALIPRVRTAFLSAQKLLVGYVGDSYLLLISRARGDAMVSQVERDLKWLEENHTDAAVAIIAHSQGAEIVRRVVERREDSQPPVDLLVTLGSGIAKLRAVERLHGNAWPALGAYGQRVLAAALTLAGPLAAAFGPLSWWWAGASVLATAPVAVWLIGRARVQLREIVQAGELPEQRLRPLVGKVNRWLDFYATSDPVPEDALPFEDLDPPGFPEARSTRIANRRSPLFDHTSYWQNAEAFRAPVIAELARLVGWRPAKPTRKLIERAQEHRLQTSKRLVAARYAVAVVAAAILLLPAVGFERDTWSDVATWLGGAGDWALGIVRGGDDPWLQGYPERHVFTVAAIVILGVLLHAAYASRWQAKARRRGDDLLRTMPPPDPGQARHHRRWRRPWTPRRTRAGSGGDASG